MASFGVVLDACVLVPVSLADTLLRIAEYGVYRPIWSDRILVEVRRAILTVHPDLDAGRVDARLHAMNRGVLSNRPSVPVQPAVQRGHAAGPLLVSRR